MGVHYKKLWKLLIDRDISVRELRQDTNIAPSTICKMRKNEYVSLDVLVRICSTLNCQLNDVIEVVYDEN